MKFSIRLNFASLRILSIFINDRGLVFVFVTSFSLVSFTKVDFSFTVIVTRQLYNLKLLHARRKNKSNTSSI